MTKRLFLLIPGLALALLIAGCSSAGSPAASSTPTATPALVLTGQATVKGVSETVLTDTTGLTLYYYTPDTTQTSACTGQCAANWPPLFYNGSGTPTAASSASGTLSVQKTANGNQVAYNGHFLYTFKGDSASGQANGEGLAKGQWLVATPALAAGAASPAIILTAAVTVKGTSETVLTDVNGLTLYYFTPDTAQTSACTGACAANWPPLLFSGTGTPVAAAQLSGTLSVQQTANGNQVEYNGHLLYTFKGDTAAGQANGEGLAGGKWLVATPTLAAA